MRADSVRRLAWGVLCAIALAQAWLFRHEISPDGVAYLDLSDAVVSGQLQELINGYWSPLYPLLIGLLRLLLSPTPLGAPQWEFAVVHLANLLAFLAALAAFEWFLRVLRESAGAWGIRAFESAWSLTAAYALFGIGMLDMISLKGPVPDLLLAATIFGAFASALRLTRDRGARTAVTLGVMLALGALTKSILFPLGVVILATVGWALRRDWSMLSLATGAFVLLTLPFVVALSISLGRPSTGETGALNYAWYVNGRQPPNTGVMPALASPRDPLPLDGLAVMPEARGTNPLWYDPARWHRDVRPQLSMSQQWPRLVHSGRYYAYVLAPFVLILVAVSVASRWADLRLAWERAYVVLVPCLAGFAAYSLVYTTSRYIAPFLVAGCVVFAAAFPRDGSLGVRRLLLAMPVTLIALLAISPLRGRIWLAAALAIVIATWLLTGRARTPHERRRVFATGVHIAAAIPGVLLGVAATRARPTDPHPEWTTARRLMTGIPQGSRIAVMGNPENAGWARLARYRIVAVIPPERVDAFKRLGDADRGRIVQTFQRAGAVQLVEIAP